MSTKISLKFPTSGLFKIVLLVLLSAGCFKSYGQSVEGQGDLPVIQFSAGSATLTQSAKAQLDAAADVITNNPRQRIVIGGNPGGTKIEQQRSWDRVNNVIRYFSGAKGIDAKRFIFRYDDSSAPENGVLERFAEADEDGSSTVPAPHPEYSGK